MANARLLGHPVSRPEMLCNPVEGMQPFPEGIAPILFQAPSSAWAARPVLINAQVKRATSCARFTDVHEALDSTASRALVVVKVYKRLIKHVRRSFAGRLRMKPLWSAR